MAAMSLQRISILFTETNDCRDLITWECIRDIVFLYHGYDVYKLPCRTCGAHPWRTKRPQSELSNFCSLWYGCSTTSTRRRAGARVAQRVYCHSSREKFRSRYRALRKRIISTPAALAALAKLPPPPKTDAVSPLHCLVP